MPAAVEPYHRDLMYKASRHPTLVNEPGVTVKMDDGEEIKLDPRNEYNKPNVAKSMNQLVRFLSGNHNDTDWDNLEPFLHGIVMAKVKVKPPNFWAKITRKACGVGKEQIIIRCAERPKETGVTLKHEGLARELFLGFHDRAAHAGFEGPELEAISRRAEHVARMLEDELHGAGKLTEGEVDARKDPVVLAVLLELAAEKAVHTHNGEDLEGKVFSFATKLLHLEDRRAMSELNNPTEAEQNKALWHLIPIQNSIKWALKIDLVKKSSVGKQLQAELETLTKIVESTVSSLRGKVGSRPTHGLTMYDEINGDKKPSETRSEGESARRPVPSASPAEVGKEEEQP